MKIEDSNKLNRALSVENLPFPTWSILSALGDKGEATVSALSLATGYSYWAVKNQIRRTPWFRIMVGNHPSVVLSDDGMAKLQRVQNFLTTPQ